jgi:hypothetical protein
MDNSLTIVGAIVHLVILCVWYGVSVCIGGNKKSSNRLPAEKAQDLLRAVVGETYV